MFVNLGGSDRRLHALLSPVVSFSGGRGEWSRFYIDVHRGISPLFFYNGFLRGTSLGVSVPAVAGRLLGIAVSDTAHVSRLQLL